MKSAWIVIAMLASTPAAADDRSDAEALFRNGATAYKNGNFKAAAENFDRAYELFKAPEIAFSAAQAHRLQYQADQNPAHVKRAIELFEIYVATTPEGGKRKDALAHLGRQRDLLRDLESKGQQVVVAPVKETPSIYVSVALENALITIDRKAAERYTAHEVEPGEHVVEVSAEGYEPSERKVSVTKGQAIVPIELSPKPAHISIKTVRDARIVVDGRPVMGGTGNVAIPPGKHLLTIYARGREPVTRELELRPGQTLALDVPLRTTTRRRAVKWVWIGGGVLLASTLVTSIIALRADGAAADLRDAADPLDAAEADRYETQRARRDTYRTASLVLGTATLATAATALWLYYFDTPSPDDLDRPIERPDATSGGFTPVVFGDGLGMSYGGRF
ncbi:MAG: PEGA domain-containing protein [Deltaproteobacteria bacterium]|nr:PEGA domain-containing protein [Deltaproteobacteria bacterium]